jgi:hypothetical protein
MVAAGCGLNGNDMLAICEKACVGKVEGFTAISKNNGSVHIDCRCLTTTPEGCIKDEAPPGAPEKTKEPSNDGK